MAHTITSSPSPSFTTFGEMLRYLRRRARLTQRELSVEVGYSESMISRLEQNERPPDIATLLAVFTPALHITNEAETIAQLTNLAKAARGETSSENTKPLIGLTIAQSQPSAKVRIPHRLTSFIGREAEIATATRLLTQARLVTLTGPGGSGKTSLAIEVARETANSSHFVDGIYLIELLPLTDPALVAQAILLGLGLEGNRARPPLETLQNYIGNKHVLIVLDNCEHLIEIVARIVETLLRHCPNLHFMTTSRERLNMPSEIVVVVPSLSFPDAQSLPAIADFSQFPAIQLFVERSQAVVPDFRLTERNAQAVVQICVWLEGIPLALELAAAALLTFSVDEIAKRLEERFLLTTPGYRTADIRHQTLNDTVAWSYNLLSPAEQQLLVRLSVFVGGWNVEAMQAISREFADNLVLLRQLIQKSLVRVEYVESTTEGHTRYHLLRAIREYATERLIEQGHEMEIRNRHFAYFAQLAIQLGSEVLGTNHQQAMYRLDADYHNIRAAFFFAERRTDLANDRVKLATSLPYFWHLRGYMLVAEGVTWLQQLLEKQRSLSEEEQGLVYTALLNLNKLSFVHWNVEVSDASESKRLLALAEPLLESPSIQQNPLISAQVMLALGTEYSRQGNHQKASAYAEKSKQLFEVAGDQRGKGFAKHLCMWLTLAQGDSKRAQKMQDENLRSLQQNGTVWSLCEAYTMQVELARVKRDRNSGVDSLKQVVQFAEKEKFLTLLHDSYFMLEFFDDTTAISLAEEFLARQRQQGDSLLLRLALHQLGRMYLNTEQFEPARVVLDEVLELWLRVEMPSGKGIGRHWSLLDRGQVARFQGELDFALSCFGESIERFAASNFIVGGALTLSFRGHVRLMKSDYSGALKDFQQCLRMVSNGPWGRHALLVKSLAGIAEAAYHLEDIELSARILPTTSALDEKRRATSIHNRFHEIVDHDRIMGNLLTYRENPLFAAAYQKGEKLSLDEAIALALQ